MKKSIKIIFTLSLLLNLILMGVVGGGLYKKYERHTLPSEFGENVRSTLKENVKKSRQEIRAQFKEMRQYSEALKEIINAPEFDQEAYKAITGKILEGKDRVARQKADVMGNTLAELSQEERQEISAHIIKRLGPKHGRKHKRGKDKHKPDNH